MDAQDYKMFLHYLKCYLSGPDNLTAISQGSDPSRVVRANFYGKVELLAYCLMPNHYHFLVQQTTEGDLKEFMRSVMTSYVTYFNKKYKRTGSLFQGIYKGVLVENDDYLLHLSRYIHLNPIAKWLTDLCSLCEDEYLSPAFGGKSGAKPQTKQF